MADIAASASTGIALGHAGSAARTEYLGRFRRGDRVPLACPTPGVPDAAPVAVILDADGNGVDAVELPMLGPSRTRFGLPYRVGLGLDLGRFRASCQYAVGGVPGSVELSFDVIAGGDSGGEVIALHALDRPGARFVVAQLASGRLARGKNPA